MIEVWNIIFKTTSLMKKLAQQSAFPNITFHLD